MISRVKIANYKSVELADFEARRVNVFIGEPNSGKSNLLEALGFMSPEVLNLARDVLRVAHTADLFFDGEVTRAISVSAEGRGRWELRYVDRKFSGKIEDEARHFEFTLDSDTKMTSFDGVVKRIVESTASVGTRYYRYRALRREQWSKDEYGQLSVPFGDNLPALLTTNKAVRESISALFKSKGFRLQIRPQDHEILMSKEVEDVIYSYPFEAISETMKRIVFYKAALESNNNAVMVFDEPEANTFPLFTKYLAERIALDETNQFFFSTHNPYVLMNVIEKTPQADLAVYATRMRNYRTELYQFTPEDCAEALDLGMDLFLNLDRFFPE